MLFRARRKIPYSTEQRHAVCIGSIFPLRMPDKIYGDGKDKNKTVFVIESADQQFQMIGTFNEFIEFSSEIMNRMYSWPIVNGVPEWFDGSELPDNTEVISYAEDGRD